MIPTNYITIDGDIALWVVEPDDIDKEYLNRPCDECGGHGGTFRSDGSIVGICAACDGTGRHTFTINNLRVHVLDVLPIEGECTRWNFPDSFGPLENGIALRSPDTEVPADRAVLWTRGQWSATTLPPAAEPGMWLVRLGVH